MPTETHLAAKRADGAELYYHDTPYPPETVVELFERYHKGAAGELLAMVKAEQSTGKQAGTDPARPLKNEVKPGTGTSRLNRVRPPGGDCPQLVSSTASAILARRSRSTDGL